MRSERANVARQGQVKPNDDQTDDVISASSEESGNRELAGVHATVFERVSACGVFQVSASSVNATDASSGNAHSPGATSTIPVKAPLRSGVMSFATSRANPAEIANRAQRLSTSAIDVKPEAGNKGASVRSEPQSPAPTECVPVLPGSLTMMIESRDSYKGKILELRSGFSGFSGICALFRWNKTRSGFWWAHQPMVYSKRRDLVTVGEAEPFQNAIDQLIGCTHAAATPLCNSGNVIPLRQILHDGELAPGEARSGLRWAALSCEVGIASASASAVSTNRSGSAAPAAYASCHARSCHACLELGFGFLMRHQLAWKQRPANPAHQHTGCPEVRRRLPIDPLHRGDAGQAGHCPTRAPKVAQRPEPLQCIMQECDRFRNAGWVGFRQIAGRFRREIPASCQSPFVASLGVQQTALLRRVRVLAQYFPSIGPLGHR